MKTLFYFILFVFATSVGSPKQHMPITVGAYYVNHHVNFPHWRTPEKTHNFRKSVESTHETEFESHLKRPYQRVETKDHL